MTLKEKARKIKENMWQDGKPKKWYYGVPIIVIWFVVILFRVGTVIR